MPNGKSLMYVHSLVTNIASVCSFMGNLPRMQYPLDEIMRHFAQLINEAFNMHVPAATKSPILLAMVKREFVAFLTITEPFLVICRDFFTCADRE